MCDRDFSTHTGWVSNSIPNIFLRFTSILRFLTTSNYYCQQTTNQQKSGGHQPSSVSADHLLVPPTTILAITGANQRRQRNRNTHSQYSCRGNVCWDSLRFFLCFGARFKAPLVSFVMDSFSFYLADDHPPPFILRLDRIIVALHCVAIPRHLTVVALPEALPKPICSNSPRHTLHRRPYTRLSCWAYPMSFVGWRTTSR